MSSERKFNVLLAVTGSVASIKILNLIEEVRNRSPANTELSIRVVGTENSLHFFDKTKLPAEVALYTDADEWESWKKIGDPVLHIELRRWADVLAISPLDANTLAKLSCGICDNLLTSLVRAWDMKKPLICCPGMNTLMWEHPITQIQLTTLKSFGYFIIQPISKTLACGDIGIGAMAEVNTIANHIWQLIS
ncbi:hypothetical protein CHUAL_002308 [Chamberlinius hualienensis]